jgi:hypothetical protein
MTPQTVNNHTMKEPTDSEKDEISILKITRMTIIMINEIN